MIRGNIIFGEGGQGSQTPALSLKPPPLTPYKKTVARAFSPCTGKMPVLPSFTKQYQGGEHEGRAGEPYTSGLPLNSPHPPRVLLTGPPQCGKTTVVHRVVEAFSGRAAGFYTREVRVAGRRVGFEIVTLAGEVAWLSHVDFPGLPRVGKYGVDLEALHRVALPNLTPAPGIDLIVVDEVGKMECLSPRFVAAVEGLWSAAVPLLITVAQKGGGFIARIKGLPGARVLTVNPGNRGLLPDTILKILSSNS
jgi:nucleoside-triphosphatase